MERNGKQAIRGCGKEQESRKICNVVRRSVVEKFILLYNGSQLP